MKTKIFRGKKKPAPRRPRAASRPSHLISAEELSRLHENLRTALEAVAAARRGELNLAAGDQVGSPGTELEFAL